MSLYETQSFDAAARRAQADTRLAAPTRSEKGSVILGQGKSIVLPATPETAAIFFGVWKLGAVLLSMSVLYGDDGIEHRLSDSEARLLVTDAENAPRFDRPWAPDVLVLGPETLLEAPTAFVPSLLDISGALRADDSETAINPRSRSAVLRVAEKIGL